MLVHVDLIVYDLNLFMAVIVFETSRTFYSIQCLGVWFFFIYLFILDNSVTETMFMSLFV